MGNGVNVYLDPESRNVLETEAKTIGMSLSAYLRAFARFLNVEVTFTMPIVDLRRQFRLILEEETRK